MRGKARADIPDTRGSLHHFSLVVYAATIDLGDFSVPLQRARREGGRKDANAYWVPVISTDTGGVSGIITHGENGFLLPLSARGSEYAVLIAEILRDEHRYADLVRTSRAAYDDRLNWDTWGISTKRFILEVLHAVPAARKPQSQVVE